MRRIENQCVQCGAPCMDSLCPNRRTVVYYCDTCGNEGAEYQIDDKDYCEDCLKEYFNDVWDCMTMQEKAEVLDIRINKI